MATSATLTFSFTPSIEDFTFVLHGDNSGPQFPGNLRRRLNNSRELFIVSARLGPEVYETPPHQVGKIQDTLIYGWEPNSSRKDTTAKVFLVFGVFQGKVLYGCAQTDQQNPGKFRQHSTDCRVFIASLGRFLESAQAVYIPRLTPPSRNLITLTEQENFWYLQFLAFPVETILKNNRKDCKDLAQKAFDWFKEFFHRDSPAAKEALEHICDAMKNREETAQYYSSLEIAWDGVGDDTVRWQA